MIEGLRSTSSGRTATAYRDPRVSLVREDGRHYLELTAEQLRRDHPRTAAADRRRFGPPLLAGLLRTLPAAAATPGGVVAQWLPLHAQSLASARMTARTFLDAFPHAQLWLPSVRDAVLIGSERPADDRTRPACCEAYADPRTGDEPAARLPRIAGGAARHVPLGRDGVERWSQGAPPITDEHPRMEFFRHQGGNMNDRDIATLLAVPRPAGPGSAD